MKATVTLTTREQRRLASAIADSTGIDYEQVLDHLLGYLHDTLLYTIEELGYNAEEHRRFVDYVHYVTVQGKTAPVGGTAS